MLVFGFRDDGMDQSNILSNKPKLGQANNGRHNNSKALEDKYKVMKFDSVPDGTPQIISTVLEEEQKTLFASNNEIVEQQLQFENNNNCCEKNMIKYSNK